MSEYHKAVRAILFENGFEKRRPTTKERLAFRKIGLRLLAVWER